MSTLNAESVLSLMLNAVGHTGDENASESVKNPTEAAALLSHAVMLVAGFRLVGFQEEDRFGGLYHSRGDMSMD